MKATKKNSHPSLHKTIVIASDHAGYDLKSFLSSELKNLGFTIIDVGCNDAKISVDYPDFAYKLCQKIIANKAESGILICGSGVGMSIAANRYTKIRAALCASIKSARLSRHHNNANVLCLGARVVKNHQALKIVNAFIKCQFEAGRHEKRVAKLSNLDA
jgi:ribose 5-phosphate isomerase B